MDRIRLGITGLEVTPLALGTWQVGGDWGDFDQREAVAAIRRARDLGVNFFDTAQAYGFGASERLLGEALRDELRRNRDELVIATKGGLRMTYHGMVRDSSRGWLREGVEESLRALDLDHIDLYQVHWPDPHVPFAETAGELQELVDEGKIRHIGVSNFDVEEIDEFALRRPVETVQPPYHLFRRGIEADLLPYAQEHDIGVLVYAPLAHGLLTGALREDTEFAPDDWRSESEVFRGDSYRRNLETVRELERFAGDRGHTVSQVAIAWTLAQPAVDVAIVGSRRAAHMDDSVGALAVALGNEDLAEIDRIMAGTQAVAGPSPESV
jgi:aryl-alcohol dehydrogenase-like predicted oxidoreductase